jgi:formylglycine-generating enzyme required for sulfatase activity/cytochrome c553
MAESARPLCRTVLPAIALCVAFGSTSLAFGADPPQYVRKADWHETIIAAREALVRQEGPPPASPAFKPYVSPVIRGGEPAVPIRVPVAGHKELYLYVVGAPEVVRGAADWADARFIGKGGKETPLGKQAAVKLIEGQLATDATLESGVSGPLRIAGRQFDRGIEMYPNGVGKVHVTAPAGAERLEAWIGIDDWVGRHGAVRFIVADAREAARQDLWDLAARDFAEETPRRQMKWERQDQVLEDDWPPGDWAALARRYAAAARRIPALAAKAEQLAAAAKDAAGLAEVRQLYYRSRALDAAMARAKTFDSRALRMAIGDLSESFADQYAGGPQYLARLAAIEKAMPEALAAAGQAPLEGAEKVERLLADFDGLQREALLANPLLDFDRLLLIRRKPHGDPRMPIGTGYGVGEYIGLPRQSSKCNPGIERPLDWDNEIAALSPPRPDGRLTTLYKPDGRRLITDLDLHWDAGRLLFSMPGTHNKWQVFEIGADGKGLRQVTPADQPDVHNYDSCYLPNGQIAFISTAPLQGVPCNAGVIVGMMYLMNGDGTGIRQVCFEQDHDHCPVVLNDGRILYLRWDYTDTPHVWNRMLFSMNPDGTGQAEYYGANGYWPNSVFYMRPIPNHPTQVVGIVTGHHVGRAGELVIFDPVKGRTEADGVVQRIPGYNQKVEPLIQDKLTEHSWPKFLHPWPLSEKYFIASCKPTPDSLWGIWLVDVFDNMVLLKEVEGEVLVEPIPLKKTPKPPVVAPKVNPNQQDALVYLQDAYAGPSMKDVPRGTVKSLRVFTYHFGYQNLAGIDDRVGADGPWECKRVLGTVRVEDDGSALFRVPAKVPFSVQPLDAGGQAIQLMRSWMTAMPGETLSCVGCHDNRGAAPPSTRATQALAGEPQAIRPWHGPERGFSFRREVQPVLEKFCVACHNGKPRDDGKTIPDLRGDPGAYVVYRGGDPQGGVVQGVPKEQLLGKYGGIFEPSYITLRRYIRVGGLESDLHLLPPMEFHAETSELVQMLRKGHHNVQLDAEAWDRLTTWIDLNAPCHGTWSEVAPIPGNQRERRLALRKLYGGLEEDGEDIPPTPSRPPAAPVTPVPEAKAEIRLVSCDGWPFDAAEAQRRQTAAGPAVRAIDLGGGVKMELVRIPAGRFVMGDPGGGPDEQPAAAVAVGKPFWMGRCEVTNEQFARFDPSHDSRFEHRTSWQFSEKYTGWPLNGARQPVVRVSWDQAMAFCRWLGERAGLNVTLPTEAQWEYACRAGATTPLFYGDLDSDFSRFANVADYTIRDLAYEGWRPRSPDLVPRDARFDDRSLVTANVGSYQPNPWGLHDMHGNAAEWTRSALKPYPYRDDDGPSAPGLQHKPPALPGDSARAVADAGPVKKVVRGGSWYDRPVRCRSAFRLGYLPYQKVFNVGFRVICEDAPARQTAAAQP